MGVGFLRKKHPRMGPNRRIDATTSKPRKASLLRKHGRFLLALVVLVPLLAPSLLVVDVSKKNPPQHNNINNNLNRQLLEHGIRGGTTSNNNGNTTLGTILPSNITIPLHEHSGSHHVHLYVGSPPQRQTLIVDTGSKAMAFPCKTTRDNNHNCCGTHASPYFDPLRSTTHSISKCGECGLKGISKCSNSNGCVFSQKYTEGSSWKATEVEDMVWLGSDSVSESIETFLPLLAIVHPFGCQTSSRGLFLEQYADGILGLSIHETSLVNGFYQEQLIPNNAFGLCFTHVGGVLSLGGSLPLKHHTAPMVAIPINKDHDYGYYSVEVLQLLMGNNDNTTTIVVTDEQTRPKLIEDINAGKGCILDSGTTDSYFPASLARVVRKLVRDYARGQNNNNADPKKNDEAYYDVFFSDPNQRRQFTYEEFTAMFPAFTVVFSNRATMDILPRHYMEHVPLDPVTGTVVPWEGTKTLVNRLYFSEPDGGTVLGANAFVGYDLVFDATHYQVGIAPADCYGAAAVAATATI